MNNNKCNCNHQPSHCDGGANIDMGVCEKNINMLPMLQTYTTKLLKPNMQCCKNVLTQQMMACENHKYVICWDFDLRGKTITVPKNCILEFDGGSLKNGTIIGQDTVFINVGDVDIWGENLTRLGTWKEWGGGSGEQVQSDWNQDDENQPDYIKNKPNIETVGDKPYDPEHFSGLGRKTLQLKGDSNILTQDDFDQENTVYVIKYDFTIGSKRQTEVTISSSNVSYLTSPEYITNTQTRSAIQERKGELETERQALIDGGASQEEIEAVNKKIAAVDSRLNTPRYYYYAAITVPAHKVLYAQCPGCVFLGNDLSTVLSKETYFGSTVDGEDTTVYAAYIHPGTYYFVEDTFISIPENSVLKFEGGTMYGGTIKGNHTSIIASADAEIFKEDIIIQGLWDIKEIYDRWFKYTYTENVANNQIIRNILGLTHDGFESSVNITRNTTYLVELPDIPSVLKGGESQSCRQYNTAQSFGDAEKDLRTGVWNCGSRFDAICIFKLNSNTRYIIDSTIKMLPTGDDYYQMFRIAGKENIVIEGKGTIYGDNTGLENTHNFNEYYDTSVNTYFGEAGFIFRACAVKNLIIRDITVSGSFGDNIYITGVNVDRETGLYYAEESADISPSKDVFLENIKVLYARRNGIAVSVTNGNITSCHFEGNGLSRNVDEGFDGVYGTAPKAGIDFECDQGTASLHSGPGTSIMCNRNVVMDNCTFRNNEYDVSSTANRAYGEDTIETYIRNCAFTSPLRFNRTAGLQLEDCYIPLLSGKGESIWYIARSEYINFIRCIFEDSNIRMTSYVTSDGQFSVADNVKFIDCVYYNDFKVEDHAFTYARSIEMAYLRVKLPPSNSDYILDMRVTVVFKHNKDTGGSEPVSQMGICCSEFTFRIDSSTSVMLKSKLLFGRGVPFEDSYDDNEFAPKIGIFNEDGYKYFIITNPKWNTYSIGVDYSLNCCKLTSSTSETVFVHIDTDPSVGVYLQTYDGENPRNKDNLSYQNVINRLYMGIYKGTDSGGHSTGVANAGARTPFVINNKLYIPTGTEILETDGEVRNIKRSGTTSNRPTPYNVGFQYLDITLNKPIWWTGDTSDGKTGWVDATGANV